MKHRATFAGALAVFLLSACAVQPTRYKPQDGAYGYSQTQIDSQTWRVVFAGNPDTPRETVENYLLYRAAEIMLFGHQEEFIVLEKEIERTRDYRPTGFYPYRYGGHDYFWRRRYEPYGAWHYGYSEPTYFAVDSYKAFVTVRSHAGGPVPAGLQIYTARDVIARLGRTVVLPD